MNRASESEAERVQATGSGASKGEALCSEAHLNPRYFYEEFRSRETLLAAVYDRHIEAVTANVLSAIEHAPLDPLARLELGLRAFLDAIAADQRAARINYFEIVGVSPMLERKRRDVLRAYAEMIAQQIAEIATSRPLPLRDYRLAAVALVGAVDGLLIDWLSGERSLDRSEILSTVLEIIEAILAPGGGA